MRILDNKIALNLWNDNDMSDRGYYKRGITQLDKYRITED